MANDHINANDVKTKVFICAFVTNALKNNGLVSILFIDGISKYV